MINIKGTLTIRVINGRNGAFSVGELQTSIGKFAVKDAILDQYDQGSYKGLFTIAKIFPYVPRPSIDACMAVFEIRAALDHFTLFDVDEAPVTDIELVSDPLDEESANTKQSSEQEKPKSPASYASVKQAFKNQTPDPDTGKPNQCENSGEGAELFGMLWPLGDEVKLDATCGRELIRKQRNYLNDNGYTLVPLEQKWIKS